MPNLNTRQISQIVGRNGFGINPSTIGLHKPSILFPKDFYTGSKGLSLPTIDIISISQEANGNTARLIKGRGWGDYITDLVTRDANNKVTGFTTNMPANLIRQAQQMTENNEGAQFILQSFNGIRAIIRESLAAKDNYLRTQPLAKNQKGT